MRSKQLSLDSNRDATAGVLYGVGSYLIWALMPVYFKLVADVPPMLVLAYRVVWSFVFLVFLSAITRRWRGAIAAMRQPKLIGALACSTAALAVNWGVFIWAVSNNRVLHASLGYFMLPLVSVAMGVTILHEKLRPMQMAGLVIAACGVAVLTAMLGQLPWVTLLLAVSFATYGLIRKIVRVDPLPGVLVESALLLPAAIVFIFVTRPHDLHGRTFALLTLSGIVTAAPLLLFTAATQRLRLTTLGFLQYVTPTGQFLLAVFAYHERFGAGHLLGFVLIWLALAVYCFDSIFDSRSGQGYIRRSFLEATDDG